MISTDRYLNLDWSLENNADLKEAVKNAYGGTGYYLGYLEEIIGSLRDICGPALQRKMKSVGDLHQLDSLVSEFKFLQYFILHGYEPILIEEEVWNGPSPDFQCNGSSCQLYVEVTSVSEDVVNKMIFDYLRLLLNQLPFIVDSDLCEPLSIPSMDKEERYKQYRLILRSLEDFTVRLMKNESPPPFDINTEGIHFEVNESGSTDGTPISIMTTAFEVPVDELLEAMVPNIIRKAIKRSRFKPSDKLVPYIIAFDCGESSIDERNIAGLLYGKTMYIDHSKERARYLWEPLWNSIIEHPGDQIPYWDLIMAARVNGWESYLLQHHIIPALTLNSSAGSKSYKI